MSDGIAASEWPSHAVQSHPWRQAHRGGTREDRELRRIQVSLPPLIAASNLPLSAAVAAHIELAMQQISALDRQHGADLAPLGTLLLRTESVASSKIESVEASVDDYARALYGMRANASATSMAAATSALQTLIERVALRGRIALSDLTEAHALLMRDDPMERHTAGQLRSVQNWIGGSDYSPRDAVYVPPPAEAVPPLIFDLLEFANRDDLPTVAQAAIAHAQFESIHPFVDGNGRIGRALINSIFRRRGATSRVVVPLASALVAHRDRYFALLQGYREGAVAPLLSAFAEASRVAAKESGSTAARLAEVPGRWREMLGSVRRGSAVAQLLDRLPAHPILSSDDAVSAIRAPRSSTFAAISRLTETGVLRPLTDRRRNQIWAATAILDEVDDLGVRIEAASR